MANNFKVFKIVKNQEPFPVGEVAYSLGATTNEIFPTEEHAEAWIKENANRTSI